MLPHKYHYWFAENDSSERRLLSQAGNAPAEVPSSDFEAKPEAVPTSEAEAPAPQEQGDVAEANVEEEGKTAAALEPLQARLDTAIARVQALTGDIAEGVEAPDQGAPAVLQQNRKRIETEIKDYRAQVQQIGRTLNNEISAIKERNPEAEEAHLQELIESDEEVQRLKGEIEKGQTMIEGKQGELQGVIEQQRALRPPPKNATEAHLRDMEDAMDDARRATGMQKMIYVAKAAFAALAAIMGKEDYPGDMDPGKEARSERVRRKKVRGELARGKDVDALKTEKTNQIQDKTDAIDRLDIDPTLVGAKNTVEQLRGDIETASNADKPGLEKKLTEAEAALKKQQERIEKRRAQLAQEIAELKAEIQTINTLQKETADYAVVLQKNIEKTIELGEGTLDFLWGVQIIPEGMTFGIKLRGIDGAHLKARLGEGVIQQDGTVNKEKFNAGLTKILKEARDGHVPEGPVEDAAEENVPEDWNGIKEEYQDLTGVAVQLVSYMKGVGAREDFEANLTTELGHVAEGERDSTFVIVKRYIEGQVGEGWEVKKVNGKVVVKEKEVGEGEEGSEEEPAAEPPVPEAEEPAEAPNTDRISHEARAILKSYDVLQDFQGNIPDNIKIETVRVVHYEEKDEVRIRCHLEGNEFVTNIIQSATRDTSSASENTKKIFPLVIDKIQQISSSSDGGQ